MPKHPATHELPQESSAFSENFKQGRRWAFIGIAGNLFLTAFKYAAGFLGNSTAMIADATHSASDLLASGAVLVSMRISEKPRDITHPYGHGGAEIISTAMCFVLLLFAGGGIFISGFEKTYSYFIHGQPVEPPGGIAFFAAVLSIVTKEWMYLATYKVGKKINSPSLIANALDHRSDVFSSIGTVAGIGGALCGIPVLDPISSMAVSVFIFRMALEIGRDSLNQIMSASCEKQILDHIRDVSYSIPEVKAVTDVRAKQQGPYIMVDLTVQVNPQLTVFQGHTIAETVKSTLLSVIEHTYDVIIHIEPYEEPFLP